jgi:hypothetical protein
VKVLEFLTAVSRQLNDQRPEAPFYRWTIPMLLHYMNLGLEVIASIRPDAITYPPQRIPLRPGIIQQLPPGMTSVTGIAGDSGRLVEFDQQMSNIPDDPCVNVLRTDCNGDPIFEPFGYSLVLGDDTFKIYPSVPNNGKTYYLNVYGNPGPYTSTSLNLGISGVYLPALEAWMLYKAHEVDMESATSMATSARQYSVFKDLLYGNLSAQVALKDNKALRA